ncbi:MAG TPA: L,D-transpeptidase family protein [Chitinophagaceae bacterium]|nr:L,D-transpeptidase family protein [Chitinophagaceae bacterium]
MKNLYLKKLLFIILIIYITPVISFSQTSYEDYKGTSFKTADIFNKKEYDLKKEFAKKGLVWPAKYVYIRSFKFDGELEVWVKNEIKEQYKLFKIYKVCMLSGTMGPKRFQGDYQVPEGFYYINEFNPNSNYHLSLGLNYPNASDRILSDSLRPGGEIYIHGSCVSVGCIPVNDDQIEELYIITTYAKAKGQDFIPVHVFPIKYSVKKSLEFLNNAAKASYALQQFVLQMREAYDKFEDKKQIPIVMVGRNGRYIFN